MSKKMTLNNLQSKVNKEYTARKILIDEYEIIIETKFRPAKIQRLINELVEKIQYAEENGFLINITDYMFILLLKYFTDIRFPEEYEKQIQVMAALIDLNYLERIISEFNQDEINKITTIFKNNTDNLSELVKEKVVKNAWF